ncbi:MAG: YicC/YloC family endoribonuclease [Hyphomicrobium sp.]
MAIQSMTGFARSDGALGKATWHWEVRSVNNRGLDIRLRLPPGYDAIEPRIREGIAKRITRGSVNVVLNVIRETQASEVRLNEAALAQVLAAALRISRELGGEPPRAETLLGLKGVLEVVEESEAEDVAVARQQAMVESLAAALDGLVSARRDEGERLRLVLAAQIDEIDRLVTVVEKAPARTPAAIVQRLGEQVARLIEGSQSLDPARLHQEAVLLATRADVEEELKRLRAHIEAVRGLFAEPGAVGRKLDFLAQEFNREANTLTSKAGDHTIARAGLALKVVIDQMREQVQNIE